MVFEPAAVSHVGEVDVLRRACILGMRRAGIDQWDETYPSVQVFEDDAAAGNLFVLRDAGGAVIGAVTLDQQQPPEYAAVAWQYPGPVGVIHRLMVSPAHQGRGHAKALMRAVEAPARARGCRALRLDTFLGNLVALRLYDALGYVRAGEVTFRKGAFACFEKAL